MERVAQPSQPILAQFGLRLRADLGGRLNQHWLVARGSQQLVLRRWGGSAADIRYETSLLAAIASAGWPVAPVLGQPVVLEGAFWSVSPLLPGEPAARPGTAHEQRERGRILASFHTDLARLDLGQRPGWRRAEAILSDPTIDPLLAAHAQHYPEESAILRWHLEQARMHITGLELQHWPGTIIHGDFAPWNLRYANGRLVGILDFELAHWDHRIAEFALAWRGKYDELILGYDQLAPLSAVEWAALTPIWWAFLLEGACQGIRSATRDDGWTIGKLLQRSPLMGPDAAPYRP